MTYTTNVIIDSIIIQEFSFNFPFLSYQNKVLSLHVVVTFNDHQMVLQFQLVLPAMVCIEIKGPVILA